MIVSQGLTLLGGGGILLVANLAGLYTASSRLLATVVSGIVIPGRHGSDCSGNNEVMFNLKRKGTVYLPLFYCT
jgi:hypothetical protein